MAFTFCSYVLTWVFTDSVKQDAQSLDIAAAEQQILVSTKFFTIFIVTVLL